jgi:hypothetical protein
VAVNFLLSIDIDWAPDIMIDFVADRLKDLRVRATWFVTHKSPAIERLRKHPDLFELGIHPNFLPHSTHGRTWVSVLKQCMTLVPEAISMRTHSLYFASPLWAPLIEHTPIRIESSLFLPHARSASPHVYQTCGRHMLRLPYTWEDGYETERQHPDWALKVRKPSPSPRIFAFHPLHVFLDSINPKAYQTIKRLAPNNHLMKYRPAGIGRSDAHAQGVRRVFLNLISKLAQTPSLRFKDFERLWRRGINL